MKTETFKLVGIGNEITFDVRRDSISISTVGIHTSVKTNKIKVTIGDSGELLSLSFSSYDNANSILFFLNPSEAEKVRKFFTSIKGKL